MELELENIGKQFGGLSALKDVSIALEKGRITALIGPNGAGKTTLFDIVSGFLRPDTGRVIYKDEDITAVTAHRLARKGIGRLFQDVRIFSNMSVLENVTVAQRHQPGENPLWALLRPRRVNRLERANQAAARELLQLVGIDDKEHLWGEQLSFGQQKLLAIARLLANESSVLLLDEPTAGVNPHMVDVLLKTIRMLANDGKTVVIIEHNLSVILKLCDWVFLLDDGEVTAFGTAKEVLEDRALQEAYLGV